MPFKDPEKRRQYQRERRRRERAGIAEIAGSQKVPSIPKSKAITRIATVQDVRECLSEQIVRVRNSKADTIVKARVIGYLAGVILKAIEVGDLEKRLEAIEKELEDRGDGNQQNAA